MVRPFILILLCALHPLSITSAAHAQEDFGDDTLTLRPIKPKKKKKGSKFELQASASALYSSNPFHYSDGDLRNFNNKTDPGERFDGLEGQSDVITTFGLGGEWTVPVGKKRDLDIELAGDYRLYTRNSIGSYFELEGGTTYEFTRRDRGSLELSFIPDRFKKNYKAPVSGLFEEANYQELGLLLDYERKFSKKLAAGVGYQYESRDFDDPFDSRDRDGNSIVLHGDYELENDIELGASLAYGSFETGTDFSTGIPIDRSFDQLRFRPELRRKVGPWKIRVRLEYRRRDYTTDEAADGGRFDRLDNRFGLRISGRKKLELDGLEMSLRLGYMSNDANPSDPTIPTDETGYDVLTAGIGFRFSF